MTSLALLRTSRVFVLLRSYTRNSTAKIQNQTTIVYQMAKYGDQYTTIVDVSLEKAVLGKRERAF